MLPNLHFLIARVKKRDASATNDLLAAFLPQIRNLSRNIRGEDTCQDLQLFLLELADKLPLERAIFQNNRILGAYIAHSLRRHSILLQSRKNRKTSQEIALDEATQAISPLHFENSVLLLTLLKTLSPKERRLLLWIYFYGYTCAEISRAHRISIQAVSQAKRKALKKLHNAYIETNQKSNSFTN